MAAHYPRLSTDREVADQQQLEWVTPGHLLFEALRRHTLTLAQEAFGKGTCFYSLQHDIPTRLDFYRARVVDGLGQVIHERLFAIEITGSSETRLREPGVLGNFVPAPVPEHLPTVVTCPEAIEWLTQYALTLFLDEVRADRLAEVDRIVSHVKLSLTELLQKADEEIGKAAWDVDQKAPRAEGRLAQVEARHSELLARRERRRQELERQRSLTLQSIERRDQRVDPPSPRA